MTYLVTTADQRAWPAEQKAVWLWRSCLGRNSKSARQLASPFYPDVPTRIELASEARAAYASIIPRLGLALNAYHGTSYENRQWEIMVGPFVMRYVRVIMNRYLKLEQCLRVDGITTSMFLQRDADVVPADTLHLIFLTDDDAWNHEVTGWFLRDYFSSVRMEPVSAEPFRVSVTESRRTPGPVRRVLERLRTTREIYINDMAASRSLKLAFYLRNGQGWLRPSLFRVNAPLEDRRRIAIPPPSGQIYGYRDAIERYLVALLPKCFVESFPVFRRQVEAEQLGGRTRVMITSTSFDADETFKMKVADEIGRGGRYVVLQHGGVYGVSPFFPDTPEERTADAFVTWGWKKHAGHLPGFCVTTPGIRIRRNGLSDRIALITINQRRKKFVWDVEPEFDAYMERLFAFIDGIGPLRARLTIRLNSAHLRSLGHEKDEFSKRYPDVRIDPGMTSIWKTMGHYRLPIFTYDSSGLLEMLSLNSPVIGFWDCQGFDQVLPDAAPFYEMLLDAGILHHSPERLAEFTVTHWGGIDAWWNSKKVQSARARFCEQYAAPNVGGAARLRRLILQAPVRGKGAQAISSMIPIR